MMHSRLHSAGIASSPSRATGRGVMCCGSVAGSVTSRMKGLGGLNSARSGVTAAKTGHERRPRLTSDDLVVATSECHFDRF
jgi:hypothetical protein